MSEQAHFDTNDFQSFRDFLQEVAGIDLGMNKQYLVATRTRRILIDNNIQTLADLTLKIRSASGSDLRQQVIDAMTTNETFWFRDTYPYDYLATSLLPELGSLGKARYRIWSAACSYGQEPYSMSMVVEEYLKRKLSAKAFTCDIVASDLSSAVLKAASEGKYDGLSLARGLSDRRLKEHFTQLNEDCWQVNSNIRQRVTFRQQNLLESLTLLGKFDVVFCRNVLIYFSTEHKQEILRQIHSRLNKGGYLILGSSENLGESSALFETINVRPGVVYRAK